MAAMEHLTLATVTDDGKRLLLVDARGAEFTLDITPSLRAALRGDASRTGQLEIKMDSTLRPRDIQARIRAGETPEDVADAARTTVDKIMSFVAPVLAERQHVADRAQKANVRRPAGGEAAAGSRALGVAVEAHLRSCNIDPSVVEWDAYRREDGRWTLNGDFAATLRTGTARFTFDLPGNYVVLDNDDARWLVGESVASPAPARDDLQGARERRLNAVPGEDLPLGDDAIELVAGTADSALPVDADFADPVAPEPVDQELPLDAFFSDDPESDDPELREEAADAAAADREAEPAPEPEPAPRRPVAKKKGRASVPSWDEIMFGPSDQ